MTQMPSFTGQTERYQAIEKNPDTGLWLARGHQSGRLASVRVVVASEGYRPDRVFREASILSEIRSPYLARIIDFGQNPTRNEYYIFMEALEGVSLNRKVGMAPLQRLSQFDALHIFSQILNALRPVHERNIIHRNIRPTAIVVSPENRITLWDFGLVQTPESIQQGMHELLLSHAYMAPELVSGDRARPATDIYSAGAVLYFMLTGHAPFEAGDWLTLARKLTTTQPLPVRWYRNDIIDPIEALVDRCLQKRPSQRFQSVEDALAWMQSEQLHMHRDVKSFRLSQINDALEHDQLEKAREEIFLLQRAFPRDRDVARVARLVWQRRRTQKRAEVEQIYASLLKARRDKAFRDVIRRLEDLDRVLDEIQHEQLEDDRYLRNWHDRLEAVRRELLIVQGISFLMSPVTNRTYPLQKDVNFVGRKAKQGSYPLDIDLSQEPDARTVSRRHAKIVRDGMTWRLHHLSTVSVTKVGGASVGPEGVELADGALVQFGKVQLRFHIKRNTSAPTEED